MIHNISNTFIVTLHGPVADSITTGLWQVSNKWTSMVHILYVLQFAKKHVSGQNDIKQRKNQACSQVIFVTRFWETIQIAKSN